MIVTPNNVKDVFIRLIKQVERQESTCEADQRRKKLLLKKLRRRT